MSYNSGRFQIQYIRKRILLGPAVYLARGTPEMTNLLAAFIVQLQSTAQLRE